MKDDGKVFIFGLRDIYGVKKCRTESINPFEPGKGVNLLFGQSPFDPGVYCCGISLNESAIMLVCYSIKNNDDKCSNRCF